MNENTFIGYTLKVSNPEVLKTFFTVESKKDRPNANYNFYNANFDTQPLLGDSVLKWHKALKNGQETVMTIIPNDRDDSAAHFVCHPSDREGNCPLRKLIVEGDRLIAKSATGHKVLVFQFNISEYMKITVG